jgi:hypothetical protein
VETFVFIKHHTHRVFVCVYVWGGNVFVSPYFFVYSLDVGSAQIVFLFAGEIFGIDAYSAFGPTEG